MKKYLRRGFTLIELLVVIAIIGLLSSIVLASVKDATKKAKLAAVKQFSANIRHALTSEIRGEWTFDNGTLSDSSGNNHTGTIHGFVYNNDGLEKKGLLATTNNAYIEFPAGEDFKLNSGSVTFEIWIKPTDSSNSVAPLYVSGGNIQLYHFYNIGVWEFGVNREDSSWCMLYGVATKMDLNEWNHIAGTYNGETGEINFYLNGASLYSQLAPTTSYPLPCTAKKYISDPASWSGIGYVYSPGMYIDEIRLYDSFFK